MRILYVFCVFISPSVALAYVDPGVFAALSQALFVIMAGGIVAFVTAPWRAIKAIFHKCVGKKMPNETEEKEDEPFCNETKKTDD